MRRLRSAILLLINALLGASGVVLADGAIVSIMSDRDRQVLDQFDPRRQAAITAAQGSPDAGAVAQLASVLAGDTLDFNDDYDPGGEWRCRYLKLGPDEAIAIYDWFSCRVFDDGAGWVIQKTSGSQRSQGRLYRLSAERLLFLGALHYAGESPQWFGTDAARNQLGVLTRFADGRLVLEFPEPLHDSRFDILEFAP